MISHAKTFRSIYYRTGNTTSCYCLLSWDAQREVLREKSICLSRHEHSKQTNKPNQTKQTSEPKGATTSRLLLLRAVWFCFDSKLRAQLESKQTNRRTDRRTDKQAQTNKLSCHSISGTQQRLCFVWFGLWNKLENCLRRWVSRLLALFFVGLRSTNCVIRSWRRCFVCSRCGCCWQWCWC